MDTATIAALSALGGAVVGALATAANTWVVQHFESRRRLRADLINVAIRSWENNEMQQGGGENASVVKNPVNLPLDDYVVMAFKFEQELDSLNAADDEALIKLLDSRDTTFTKIIGHRLNRVFKNAQAAERLEKELL